MQHFHLVDVAIMKGMLKDFLPFSVEVNASLPPLNLWPGTERSGKNARRHLARPIEILRTYKIADKNVLE